MTRWLPRTLFGQVLCALLAGLLLANGLGLWLVLDDRVRLSRFMRSEYAANRVADSVLLLNDTPAAGRARLLQLLNTPATSVSLDEAWLDEAPALPGDVEPFAAKLTERLAGRRPFQVLNRLGEPAAALPQALRRLVRAPLFQLITQARLDDGAVLTFRYAPPPGAAERPLRIIALLSLVVLAVSLLSVWVVRRLTLPLSMLSAAAEGLASDLDRSPLPESGPVEVARAAHAFNRMQTALRELIGARAQALAGVSHDLRLPLTRLRLRLESLPPGALREAIEHDLQDMDTLIDDTLAFLRAGDEAEKPVPLRLDALVEGLADDMQALGAQVQVQGALSVPVLARPAALRRALGNLMDNARRYGGGHLHIRLGEEIDAVTLDVEDDGPGIPEAELERVFEPYVRLEHSRARHTGGSGLGLAIARAVARAHGGTLVLSPRSGGGLRARLRLPR